MRSASPGPHAGRTVERCGVARAKRPSPGSAFSRLAGRGKRVEMERAYRFRLWAPMKLKLVVPGWPETSPWHRFIFPFPPLSLTTLAAAAPDTWQIVIEDENVAPLDPGDVPDLVGLTAMTPLAPRAYEVAALYRARGARVVMGGFHASMLPAEAKRHVDSVVVGEAEALWPQVLEDASRGRLQPFYRAGQRPDLSGLPPARRDLLAKRGYVLLNTLQTTRGCPFDCDFCSVTAFYGRTIRARPLEDVERELETMRGDNEFVFFVDDNIFGNTVHARKLFTLLKNYSFRWMSQSSITLADHPELLRMAAESGCCRLFIGDLGIAAAGQAKDRQIVAVGELDPGDVGRRMGADRVPDRPRRRRVAVVRIYAGVPQ